MSLLNKIEQYNEYVGISTNSNFLGFDEWSVVLYYEDNRTEFPFYMGSGFNGEEPELKNVLECLYSDAEVVEQGLDFSEFCSSYGYEKDHNAKAVYQACKESYNRLKVLFESDFDSVRDEIFNDDDY